MSLKGFFGHLRTINRHRHKVIAHCAKAGILWQGLRHDLSKYSPTEFIPGVKYFQGTLRRCSVTELRQARYTAVKNTVIPTRWITFCPESLHVQYTRRPPTCLKSCSACWQIRGRKRRSLISGSWLRQVRNTKILNAINKRPRRLPSLSQQRPGAILSSFKPVADYP